ERLAHPHEGHRVVVDACAYFDQIVQGRSQWTRTADRPAWMPHSRSAPEVWPTSSRRWTAGASGRRPVRPWSTASTSRDASPRAAQWRRVAEIGVVLVRAWYVTVAASQSANQTARGAPAA